MYGKYDIFVKLYILSGREPTSFFTHNMHVEYCCNSRTTGITWNDMEYIGYAKRVGDLMVFTQKFIDEVVNAK